MSSSRLLHLGLFLLAVHPEPIKVSAWVPVSRNNCLPATVVTYHPRIPAAPIYSTIEDSIETLTDSSSATETEGHQITIPMPKIHYTVPGMKPGWKEDGIWMDKDGPRNGPPQNFWRQMGDERLYNDNIDLIQTLLKLNSVEANDIENTMPKEQDCNSHQIKVLNGMVERLERTNSIRIPSLNRLVLGAWAPIMRGGKVVAEGSTDDKESVYFPYRFHVQRSAGQKLAPKTHYGTFDEHLEPGEEITVQELSSCNTVTSSGVLEVSSDKKETKLVEGYRNSEDGDLYLGGITYVTKYIMIMRRQELQQDTEGDEKIAEGPVTEIWMRIDAS